MIDKPINELATALALAQSEMKDAIKDSVNPHFKSKYADLASVWEACRTPLTKHGLSIAQTSKVPAPELGAGTIIVTHLLHKSGQSISGELFVPILDRYNAQSVGAAITYGRRFGLAAIVGVSPSEDDGNSISLPNTVPHPAQSLPPLQVKTHSSDKLISEAQAKRLYAIAKSNSWSESEMKSYCSTKYNIQSSQEIPVRLYDEIVAHFQKPLVKTPTLPHEEDVPLFDEYDRQVK